jgi:hypothetical protein
VYSLGKTSCELCRRALVTFLLPDGVIDAQTTHQVASGVYAVD